MRPRYLDTSGLTQSRAAGRTWTCAPLIAEFYVQDSWRSWRITRKLTLDYGLGIGTYIPVWTRNLEASSFDPSKFNSVQAPLLYQPAFNPQGVRSALNPVNGQYLPAVEIGLIIPGTGSLTNGLLFEGASGVPKGFVNNLSPTWAPRFGFGARH